MTTRSVAPDWVARVDEVLHLKERSWAWLARKVDIDDTVLNRIKHGQSHGRVSDLDEHQRELVAEILEVPKNWIFQPEGP
jgi:ribosome-binding protein aMBF1 (putative translation factor)|tara:strand:- start:339 stop:578 length:240 start_codon:yes stop_codon:yes gene_type:complete